MGSNAVAAGVFLPECEGQSQPICPANQRGEFIIYEDEYGNFFFDDEGNEVD